MSFLCERHFKIKKTNCEWSQSLSNSTNTGVLVTIAIVFCHKFTQTSWCCAISTSLEVNFFLGTKIPPDPGHPGGVAFSGPLHCHSVSRNSSFTPHLPKANCSFIRKYSLSLEFCSTPIDLSLSQTSVHPLGRDNGISLPRRQGRQLPQGTSTQDGCASAMWRCLKVVWLCFCRAVLKV